ncbi:hypothetical protein [Chryseobacterium indoltheticum]|uniref:hypothetical protein n=1 Tax=Chryseobacterium indoltheticum TaxID=254 RepID=UPI00242B9764|nr:hypothetical protein [Chryseobacterium indoltheticum]
MREQKIIDPVDGSISPGVYEQKLLSFFAGKGFLVKSLKLSYFSIKGVQLCFNIKLSRVVEVDYA